MGDIINTTIIGLFFGTIGTTIGGIIGCVINSKSDKFLSFILSFAAGLMMAVICFDLIPEALEISQISETVVGIFVGILAMIICDLIVDKKFKRKTGTLSTKSNSFSSSSSFKILDISEIIQLFTAFGLLQTFIVSSNKSDKYYQYYLNSQL